MKNFLFGLNDFGGVRRASGRRWPFQPLDPLFFPHLSRALWAFVIGVIYGLFYYVMYKKVVKNLFAIFPHACLGRYVWLGVSCIS